MNESSIHLSWQPQNPVIPHELSFDISKEKLILNNESKSALTFDVAYHQSIKQQPFQYISDQVSRDTLFRITYLLQEEHNSLMHKLDMSQNYGSQNIKKIGQATDDEKEAIIEKIRINNLQYIAQLNLLEMYKQQKAQLQKKLAQKQASQKQLKQEHDYKQAKNTELSIQLKQQIDKLMELKKIKQQQLQKMRKMDKNSGQKDSSVMDKLLAEYYETMKEVMHEDSIQKINNKTKEAVLQLNKKKWLGVNNI